MLLTALKIGWLITSVLFVAFLVWLLAENEKLKRENNMFRQYYLSYRYKYEATAEAEIEGKEEEE